MEFTGIEGSSAVAEAVVEVWTFKVAQGIARILCWVPNKVLNPTLETLYQYGTFSKSLRSAVVVSWSKNPFG